MSKIASPGVEAKKSLDDLTLKLPKELPGGPLSTAEERFLASRREEEAQLKAILDFISNVEKLKDVFRRYHSKDVPEKERKLDDAEFSKTAKAMGLDSSKFKNAKEFLDCITDHIEARWGKENAKDIVIQQGCNTLQARAELWPKEWGPIVEGLGIKISGASGKSVLDDAKKTAGKTGGLSRAEVEYLEFLAVKEEERKEKEKEKREAEAKAKSTPKVEPPKPTPARPTSVTITSVGGKTAIIEEVSESEADRILNKAEFHSDFFIGELNAGLLKKNNLTPEKKVVMDGVAVWLSNPYEADYEGRIAVVGFVQKDSRIIARTFYRSNSQGIWRYLPSYTSDDKGNIDWYHKGFGEESIMLPIRMQKALAELSKDESSILHVRNPKLIFTGTARRMKKGVNISMPVYVESTPKGLNGNFYEKKDKSKNAGKPESLIFTDASDAPDFSKPPSDHWMQKTEIYGEVNIEVFTSRNGKYYYMFCSDKLGRAWIGGIEDVNSPLTPVGLKAQWVNGGNLTTPAFEYKTSGTDQTGGYGNDKLRNGPYIDMHENYLKHIPIIKEYQERRDKRLLAFPF